MRSLKAVLNATSESSGSVTCPTLGQVHPRLSSLASNVGSGGAATKAACGALIPAFFRLADKLGAESVYVVASSF